MAITTVSSHVVSVNAIQGTLIADNAITAVHIATNAVSGTLIADNAVTATHIAQNTITVTQIADDAIEAAKLADGIITTNHLNKAMISSQTEVTAVAGDFLLIGDTSDSNNLKKIPISGITALVDLSSKANIASPSFTGTVTITGASSAYNTLQLTSNSTGHGTIINLGDTSDADYGSITQFASSAGEGGRMRFIAGTTETMNLRGGKVGIGVSSPDAPLHINGSANSEQVIITGNTNANRGLSIQTAASGGQQDAGVIFDAQDTENGANPYHAFKTAGTERMRIDGSGKVGIGTTAPGTNHSKANNLVVGSGSAGGMAIYNGTSEGWYAFSRDNANNTDAYDGGMSYTNRVLTFHVNSGTERLRIDGEGNLSFGTEKVDPNWSQFFNAISGNYGGHVSFQNNSVPVTTLGNNFYLNNSTLNERVLAYPSQQFKLDHQQNFLWESAASGTAGDTFSFTEHMRLNSNGTLMVGTATNPSYPHRIFADGNAITNGTVRFNDNDVSCGLANVVLMLSFGSDDNCSSASFLYMADSGGSCGSITAGSNGNNVNYNTTSDERLKKNIVDASSQLNTIKNIKVREFDWKKNDYHEVGVIAQELITLIPDAVQEGGDDESDRPFGVDYGKLTPYIIKALQEQQTIIEDLKSRIETLEG